ncbi:head morphogenesis protein [candidate division KSB1 bacterium]|nr:head morphogenesis protein [candidate division KSB1 bacterium]
MKLHKKIEKLVGIYEASIRDAFLSAIADISNRAILSEIIESIESGDIERAIRSLGLTDSAFRSIISEIERAFEVGGVTTGESFPKILTTPTGRTVFRFDVRNSRAEAWLRDKSSTLVTSVAETTRATVRQTLQRGMAEGVNPRTTALDLVGRIDRPTGRRVGGVIGLTPQQESWVANTGRDLRAINDLIELRASALQAGNVKEAQRLFEKIENHQYFRRDLRAKSGDKVILNSARNGEKLNTDSIQKLKTQYESNALRYRGEVIGRTESIASLNRSEHEAIKQAVDMGAVRSSAVKRVWDSAGNDGRTRESHLKMEGQTVGLDEPFTFPDGSKAMFPGDNSLGAPGDELIQCRCIARTEIDWLAGARDVVNEKDRAALLALSDAELTGGR